MWGALDGIHSPAANTIPFRTGRHEYNSISASRMELYSRHRARWKCNTPRRAADCKAEVITCTQRDSYVLSGACAASNFPAAGATAMALAGSATAVVPASATMAATAPTNGGDSEPGAPAPAVSPPPPTRVCLTPSHAVVALLAFLASGSTIGMSQYSFGVFVEGLTAEYGWSRTSINAALSIGLVVNSLVSPAVGFMLDHYGARKMISLSLVLVSSAFVILGFAENVWVVYGAYVVLYFGFPSCTMIGTGKLVGSWFRGKTKGRIMGMVAAGNNFGGLTMVQLSTFVASEHSWRTSAFVFASLVGVLAVIFSVVVRNGPDDHSGLCDAPSTSVSPAAKRSEHTGAGRGAQLVAPRAPKSGPPPTSIDADGGDFDVEAASDPASEELPTDAGERAQAIDDPAPKVGPPESRPAARRSDASALSLREAMRTRRFYILSFALACAFYTYGAVVTQVLNAMAAEGFSSAGAANILSALALTGIGSKLTFGFLSERITARRSLMIVDAIMACACVCFALASTVLERQSTAAIALNWTAAVVYGSGFGGVGALIPLCTLEQFGVASYGKILGVITLLFLIPALCGPIVAGQSYDATGSYATANVVAVGVFAMSAVGLQCLPAPVESR